MKKFAVVCLTLVVLMSLSLTVLAAPGAFVSSPSGNAAPEMKDFEAVSEDCTGSLKITSYADRANLDEATRLALEKAYAEISNPVNNSFATVLAKLAKELNTDVSELSVSDLFDISVWDCTHHEPHEGFVITLASENVANMVAVLHYNVDTWEIIELNELDKEAGTVTFTTPSLSPFAFVVDTNPANNVVDEPSEPTNIGLFIGIAAGVVAAAAIAFLIVLVIKRKKKNA